MRCKTCDYPLWNLKARQCPECGAAFVPSEFDFVINSVQFCCPFCDQAYYGTGEKGRLVPFEFNCVTCGVSLNMDAMVLRPSAGVREEQTQVDRMPWLERAQRGWIRAWLHTVGKSMINPQSLMRGVPPDSGVLPAWGFVFLTAGVIFTLGLGLPLLAIGVIMYLSGDQSAGRMFATSAGSSIGGFIALLVLAAAWGASVHGILRITGKTEHTIGRTYQALLYSAGVNAVLAVPCIGPYCGVYFLWIWWAIAAIVMLMDAQQVRGGRAALAVLPFPLVLVGSVVAIYAYFVFGLMTTIGGVTVAGPTSSATFETTYLAQSVTNYAESNNGQGPAHAVELIQSGLNAGNFISSSGATDADSIPLADVTLGQVDDLPPNRQRAKIQAAVAALPPKVIAHRCGDFVFTYHGMDLRYPDPNLWIVILWPDPDANPGWQPAPFGLVTAMADGRSRVMYGDAAILLSAQNDVRAKHGLPPLPDPATVTHGQPGVTP